MTLTLREISTLCRVYVPKAARHPGSFSFEWRRPPKWWPAHEIGHMLVAAPRDIHRPMFGLGWAEDTEDLTDREVIYARVHELAAMAISEHLLSSCGRDDLVRAERNGTDDSTLAWDPGDRVRRLLERRGVIRGSLGIPSTRVELEAMLVEKRDRSMSQRSRSVRAA